MALTRSSIISRVEMESKSGTSQSPELHDKYKYTEGLECLAIDTFVKHG